MLKKSLCGLMGLMVGVFLSCSGDSDQQSSGKEANAKERAAHEAAFKVAVLPTLDALPFYLLKDSLLYDSTKVDIRLFVYTAQMDVDTALIGGSVQAGMTDLVRAERIKRKTPLRFVTATNAYWQLVGNRRSRLNELSQLADKMVAMTRFSATDMLTDLVLKKGNLKYPAYRIQINDVFVRTQMLENNELDALWMTEPFATKARIAGHKVLFNSESEGIKMGCVVVREQDAAGGKRIQELKELEKAYNKACRDINRHGIAYYASLISKYMDVDVKVIEKLPKIKFTDIALPTEKDVETARKWNRG